MRLLVVVLSITDIVPRLCKVSNASDGRVKLKYIVDGGRPARLKSVAVTSGTTVFVIALPTCLPMH